MNRGICLWIWIPILIWVGTHPLLAQMGQQRFFPMQKFPNETTSCTAIFQDSLGFMWFGSDNGLFRFDGQSMLRFQNDRRDSTSLSQNSIWDIDSHNGLDIWVATEKGLDLYERSSQVFRHFAHDPDEENSLGEERIKNIKAAKNGLLWIGLSSKGLQSYDPQNERFERVPLPLDDPQQEVSISQLFEDSKGRLWIGTEDQGLYARLPDGQFWSFTQSDTLADGSVLSSNTIRGITEQRDGTILIGTSGGGLNYFDPEKQTFRSTRKSGEGEKGLSSDEAFSVMEDRRGNLWVGTWAKGLNCKARGGQWQHLQPRKGVNYSFPGDVVVCMFEDRAGMLWFGTLYNGLAWYDPRHDLFEWFQNDPEDPNSLSRNNVIDILELSADSLLIGTYQGGLNLYLRSSGQFILMEHDPDAPTSIPNNGIWSMHRDRKGRVWVGTSRGLSLMDPQQLTFKTYGKEVDNPKGLSNNNVLCIEEDREGNLWLGTWGGGMNRFDPQTEEFQRFLHDPEDPLSISGDAVKTILQDSRGKIWAGTKMGLSCYDPVKERFLDGHIEALRKVGLYAQNINCLAEAPAGKLWIGTNSGLFVYEKGVFRPATPQSVLSERAVSSLLGDASGLLYAASSDGLFQIDPVSEQYRAFQEAEGIPSDNFKLWSVHRGPTGRMYFGTANGLLSFQPEEISLPSDPPQLVLTGFYLNNKEVKPGSSPVLDQNISLAPSLRLSHRDYLFSLQFAALDFQLGDRIRYRYRLEGFDQDWIETDQANRRATYTNVPSGTYQFQVQSQVDDGLWQGNSRPLQIEVLPPWWETWWARALLGLLVILLLWVGFRLRIRVLQSQKAHLADEVRLRTQEIQNQNDLLVAQKEMLSQEKAISENLLLNILPKKVAEELKIKQKATPRLHKEVSVLFLDFVGFTRIATQLSPEELVEQLDLFFVEFDRIVMRHGLEKIKTIGDAYMCAGGLPEPQAEHCLAAVRAGQEMLAFIARTNALRRQSGKPEWQARIGIHTGEVVAGVVGERKFAYDIWGDTVNTASRIQSNGEVGRVNVSAPVYTAIKDEILCQYRGQVHAKNKGLVDLYAVADQLA